ncbi:MAG: DoxX family protein [Alphaproteobacteria bacterium]|nr:DoxX family protein [Alphaproteobacteria bacterium]
MSNAAATSPAAPATLALDDATVRDAGLLLLRVVPAVFMLTLHGWGKLQALLAGAEGFPDPLGVGSLASATLAVGAEVGASAFVAVGLFTRLATVPLVITMAVAAFVLHAGDDLATRESALVYLTLFLTVAALGPGRWSLDGLRAPRA